MEEIFYQKLRLLVPKDRIRVNEPMEEHTSLHIGGKADYLVIPETIEEIRDTLKLCRQESIPFYIMGNGSNLLVSDQGYRGLIIKLGEGFSKLIPKEDGIITAQSGILLSKLAAAAAEYSLTGFEFASGIPGTLGGAVTMNAGAYGGEMKQCLTGARVMDGDGNILELSAQDLKLGYRSSIIQTQSYIVLEADIKLAPGDPQTILEKMEDLNRQRREKQPLDQYSVGSTFKRPQGHYTGQLINDAGLRGYQVGGAAVSDKHCGFVINKDHATAKDFLTVIGDVIRIVEEQSGVRLEPEVRFLGEF